MVCKEALQKNWKNIQLSLQIAQIIARWHIKFFSPKYVSFIAVWDPMAKKPQGSWDFQP